MRDTFYRMIGFIGQSPTHWATWIALFAVVCSSASLFARPANMRFDHFSVGDGLSHRFVTCVLQDRQGFLWVGTQDGLNRFDGYSFTTYHHDEDDPSSLSHDYIQDIAEGPDGQLWVGTNAGLCQVVPQAGPGPQHRFVSYVHDPEDPHTPAHPVVRVIALDSHGVLWIGTNMSLERMDPTTHRFVKYDVDSATRRQKERGRNAIEALLFDRNGSLWVGYFGLGVSRFSLEDDGVSLRLTGRFLTNNRQPGIKHSNLVNDMLEDDRGGIWVASWAGGLSRIDSETGQVQVFSHDPDDPTSLPGTQLMALTRDPSGAIWAACYSLGIIKIIPPHDEMDRYTFAAYQPNAQDAASLSGDSPWAIYCDRSSVLWVGDATGGLSKGRSVPGFHHYEQFPDQGPGSKLLGQPIAAILEDSRGNLWVGSREFNETATSGGITLIQNPYTPEARTTYFTHDPADPASLSGNPIITIFEDSQQRLWVGTDRYGLNKIEWDGSDPDTVRFRHWRHDVDDPNSLPADAVLTILEDHRKQLWVGTWDRGVALFDPESGAFTPLGASEAPVSLGVAPPVGVRKIIEDRNRNLWFATGGSGLYRYNPTSATLTRYRHDPGNLNTIVSNNLYSLYEAPDGIIWIAADGGLGRLDPESQRFKSYRVQDGLPNPMLHGLEGDVQDGSLKSLWISTAEALARFDPEAESFVSFEYEHDAQVSRFVEGGYFQNTRGDFFFGGYGGMIRFSSSEIMPPPSPPSVVFTDLKIFSHSVTVGQKSSGKTILNRPLPYTDHIYLGPEDFNFSVDFVLLDSVDPSRNRLRYRLENYERAWVSVNGGKHTVSYSQLDPGAYQLRVQGVNSDGVWSPIDRTLAITILPPLSQQLWFQLLISALIVLSLFIGLRQYIQSIHRRNRELNEHNRLLREQIQERLRVTEELRISEERYRTLVRNLPALIFRSEPETTWALQYASEAAESVTGYSAREIVSDGDKPFSSLIMPEDLPDAHFAVKTALAHDRHYSVEYRILDPRGEMRWLHEFGQGVKGPDGKLAFVDGAIFNVTARKEAENRLRASEQNLAITLDSINEGVIVTNNQGVVTRMNPVAEQMTGWPLSQAEGHLLSQILVLVDPDTKQNLSSPVFPIVPSGRHSDSARPPLLRDRDHLERPVSWSAAPIRDAQDKTLGAVLVLRDETEKERLEERLRHAQKMESLGRLAGGIAHDFNNLLSPILAASELIQLGCDTPEELCHHASLIQQSAERAAGLTRQMLSFSRKEQTVSGRIDIHKVIDESIGMLKHTIDRKIEIFTHFQSAAPFMMGDATMLQNAILNLAINARDAMPDGGRLTFSTKTVQLKADDPQLQSESLLPGPYLEIQIKDTGMGMDSETLQHIFEPFFTTKARTKGTGLGMATAYSTITRHQGAIHVASTVNQGTTISIIVPQCSSDASPSTLTATMVHGQGRILVVDDEDWIRHLLENALTKLGYTVSTAANGKEAVAFYQNCADEIDLVILDYMMPKMNGRETLAFFHREAPNLPVLFCSGFSAGIHKEQLIEEGAVGFVEKPFQIAAFSKTIAEILSEK